MKKKVLIGLALIILILDFLALDDITTGKEPDYFMEYLTIIVSVPALLAIGYFLFRNRGK